MRQAFQLGVVNRRTIDDRRRQRGWSIFSPRGAAVTLLHGRQERFHANKVRGPLLQVALSYGRMEWIVACYRILGNPYPEASLVGVKDRHPYASMKVHPCKQEGVGFQR